MSHGHCCIDLGRKAWLANFGWVDRCTLIPKVSLEINKNVMEREKSNRVTEIKIQKKDNKQANFTS